MSLLTVSESSRCLCIKGRGRSTTTTKLNVGAAIVKLIGELMEEPADALPEDQDQSEELTAEDRRNLEALGLNLLEKS